MLNTIHISISEVNRFHRKQIGLGDFRCYNNSLAKFASSDLSPFSNLTWA